MKMSLYLIFSFLKPTVCFRIQTMDLDFLRWWWRLVAALLLLIHSDVEAQQNYVNNAQLNCSNTETLNLTRGYECNGVQSSCQSYLTFRSTPTYNTPALIAYLLAAPPSSVTLIVSLNNLTSDVAPIPVNTQVIVPVNCSCFAGKYYQHNASYTLKPSPETTVETYFSVANNTYQSLTTCQALMEQNPYGERNLLVGFNLQVPLRCACPTSEQAASGFKYLLTYLISEGESISSIAEKFGLDSQTIKAANNLSSDLIFYFTNILVPLTKEPTKIQLATAPPPAPPPPQTPIAPVGGSNSSSNSKWIYIGVGIGVALVVLCTVFAILFWRRKRKSGVDKAKPVTVISSSEPKNYKAVAQSDSSAAIPDSSKSWSLSSQGIQSAIESLTVYKFRNLQTATNYFSEENRIKGSVYKGSFNGDEAAVKVMKGDVSSEINMLKKINHSNIIRLSGFCVHSGNTYLVYELAENGALRDCLTTLTWKQRVQIAYDVADALNYLHCYTSPPYIHKNLNTSNVLLDCSLRAKIANFGMARMLDSDQSQEGVHLTRHVIGTHGYMAPEYLENGVVTPKLDVFAFGVVVLELLSGKEAAGDDEMMLSALIKQVLEGDNVRDKLKNLMDPSLENQYPLDLAFSLANLAKSCVSHDINARPSMPQVFVVLSKILSSSLDWDPSLELPNSISSRSTSSRR